MYAVELNQNGKKGYLFKKGKNLMVIRELSAECIFHNKQKAKDFISLNNIRNKVKGIVNIIPVSKETHIQGMTSELNYVPMAIYHELKDGKAYLKYNNETEEYFISEGKIGCCVFPENIAEEFAKVLQKNDSELILKVEKI